MSKEVRRTNASRHLVSFALALALAVILAFAVACASLDAESTDSSAATTATTAVATADVETDSLDSLFGTWDGTYTPDTAWDENGVVDDPPFALDEPVAMHMELRPWSASSASYGSLTAGSLYPARVASLTMEGDEATLIIVTEESGLEDLLGLLNLTLDGDTLTGEDERRPEVPSGWISTSGTISLTRTAAWDPTATTDTTAAAAAPAPAPADEAADEDADEPHEAEMIPSEPEPPVLELAHGDGGGHATISVGDSVTVHLEFAPEDEVAEVRWTSTASAILFKRGESWIRDPETHIYSVSNATFDANAPGNVGMICLSLHEDGTLHEMWQYYLVVE